MLQIGRNPCSLTTWGRTLWRQFVGLDVSQQETHVCVVDRDGTALWRGTCASSPAEIAAIIKEKAPSAVRVGLETGPLATWHWHALKASGLPVICIDARHAKAVLSMQINKTDRNDAYGLAQIMRTGWYREVGVKSLDGHKVRAILGARAQLVGMRTDLRNQIRGLLKIFGIILERHGGKSFQARVMQVAQDDGIPGQSLHALLAILTSIERQLDRLSRIASDLARLNPICRNLMTIPGVGALTAVAFVAAIEDPRKFAKSPSVGAYLGSRPNATSRVKPTSAAASQNAATGLCASICTKRQFAACRQPEMVVTQGLGHADRQALRHEQGQGGGRAETGRYHAPDVDHRRRVPLVEHRERCSPRGGARGLTTAIRFRVPSPP